MREILKSKVMLSFIIIVLGVVYFGNNNSQFETVDQDNLVVVK